MIIDCHCHAGHGDGLTGPWDTSAPLTKYLRRASRAGIERTVLFPAFHSDYMVANNEVSKIVDRDRHRFIGFCFVHPVRDRGRVEKLVRLFVERRGFRGIKVHRHDARISREICEVADAMRVPILYDPMGEVSTIELIAIEYPRVQFIIPHLGSFADDWRAQMACIDQLVKHPNVYTDTSGIRRFDLLEEAVRRAGPQKVLFGSDGPWLHPGVELAKVRLLGLATEDERWILGQNLLRLLSIRTAQSASIATPRVAPIGDSPPDRGDPWASQDVVGA